MTTNTFSTIRLVANNTLINGNPRRCYVTFQEGNLIAVYDEEHNGVHAITHKPHRDAYVGYSIHVSVGEYRRWLKIGQDLVKNAKDETKQVHLVISEEASGYLRFSTDQGYSGGESYCYVENDPETKNRQFRVAAVGRIVTSVMLVCNPDQLTIEILQ